ncbi:hypothetical protein CDL62_12220 [Alkalitalea saponilacus]|uniref:Uncharacterized protein n=1 Tax=Alkalitalea saponilacus TaxID=889453 RepID=A0A1T5CEX1_9BACT|nr:hypothetical protein CDL62_12220 [Alkalitalea saponilacus]SKB57969.1 hypothetical protein SAMN03080601_00797 [Alkalitalea saponilacus]
MKINQRKSLSIKLPKILSSRLTNKTEIRDQTANSVYVAIAGEVINLRSVLFINFVQTDRKVLLIRYSTYKQNVVETVSKLKSITLLILSFNILTT